MIQEFLNGSSCSSLIEQPKLSPSFTPSPSTTTPASSSSTTLEQQKNLRCPRCDSSNTKFCYYNNYNLTQPRHFCKTCRRYWTKGGALRNIPIRGGCRKNKTFNSVPTSAKLIKTLISSSDVNRRSSLINGLDHSSILCSTSTSPQTSHLQLALMGGATQNSNPNTISNPFAIKAEAQQQPQNYQQQGQQNGFVIGEILQNTAGMQELYHYQRMRSSTKYYSADNSPVTLGNLDSSLASSTILESAPVGALGELGIHWNPSLSWSSGLPTTNGAYI